MNILFVVGSCILMNGTEYRVTDASQRVYLLRQAEVIHERKTYFYEYWKTKYVNRVAKQVTCSPKTL